MNKIINNKILGLATAAVAVFAFAMIFSPVSALAYGYSYPTDGYYNPSPSGYYNPTPIVIQPQPIFIPAPVIVQVPTPVYYPVPVAVPVAVPVYYRPLAVSCSASTNYAQIGQQVTWNAYVSGNDGNYNYSWSGSEGLNGYGASVSGAYNTPGQKLASVTINSNGQTITEPCNSTVIVAAPIVIQPVYTPVQVPIYNPTPAYKPKAVVHINANKVVVKSPKTIVITNSVEIIQRNLNGQNQNGQTVQNSQPTQSPTVNLQPQNQTQTAGVNNFTLSNVPWGWVAALVILILFATVLYLLFNRQKI